jgi:O-antigen biosynthesis protein
VFASLSRPAVEVRWITVTSRSGAGSVVVLQPIGAQAVAERGRVLGSTRFSLTARVIVAVVLVLASPFLALLLWIMVAAGLLLAAARRAPRGERARGYRDAIGVLAADEDAAPQGPWGDKVLVLQSAEASQVVDVIARLDGASYFRNPSYCFLGRDDTETLSYLARQPRIERVIPHSGSRGWWRQLRNLGREDFDFVVLFLNGDPSYWKMKWFALIVRAGDKVIIDEDGTVASRGGWLHLVWRDLFVDGIIQVLPWHDSSVPGSRGGATRVAHDRRRLPRTLSLRAPLVAAPAGQHGQHASGEALIVPAANETASPPPAERPAPVATLDAAKQTVTSLAEVALRSLLSSRARLEVPSHPDPMVSIILVLHNRAELTLQCLRSLSGSGFDSVEVVIVDNASSDATSALLDRVRGAEIVRNVENVHFLEGANVGARHARGRYLLFLNNDAQVLPGTIAAAVRTIESESTIGAVGGKLILPDGALQEAGSIVWQDGSTLGYGRAADPFAPPYMFRRDVDYCSGAFLLTRRDTFMELGGFDDAFKPYYYEDADFCLKLWERGLRVVYEPDVVVLHYEFGSSTSTEAALAHQLRNRDRFVDRHRERLRVHQTPSEANILLARTAPGERKHILFVDDRIPHPFLGSGFPRARAILTSLLELGHFVTFVPTDRSEEDWHDAYADVPREVEVMTGVGRHRLADFLAARAGYYHAAIISRPHNMQAVRPFLVAHPEWTEKTRVIYDAEAVYALRDVALRKLEGNPIPEHEIETMVRGEVDLASASHAVMAVSEWEREEFAARGVPNVHVLGHALLPSPTPRPFEERSGFLFVGAIHADKSPNGDAVLWFSKKILPLIRKEVKPASLAVAGFNSLAFCEKLSRKGVKALGQVDDLTPVYDRARVFVAPSRFAAGIPLKVLEAAAHGIPVVATSVLAQQLGWRDGEQLLVADDPGGFASQCVRLHSDQHLWESVRDRALQRVEVECSPRAFTTALETLLRES